MTLDAGNRCQIRRGEGKMNREQLAARFPNASPDFLARNAEAEGGKTDIQPDRSGKVAELERHPGHGAVGKVCLQKGDRGKFLVVIKSFRKRLLDVDNLAEKFHVDLCRYAGILPSDAPGTAEIKVCQEKVGKGEEERVTIEIYSI